MPYINVKTNQKADKSKCDAVKTRLGSAISLLPGKSEAYLMVSLEPESVLYFKGSDKPCAIAEVKIFGSSAKSEYNDLTAEICSILNEELDIPKDRIYTKFDEVENWGYNSFMF